MGIMPIKRVVPDVQTEKTTRVRELISEDTHPAVFAGIYDLGFQLGSDQYPPKNNKVSQFHGKTAKQKIAFAFEVDEVMEGEGEFKGKRKLAFLEMYLGDYPGYYIDRQTGAEVQSGQPSKMYTFLTNVLGKPFSLKDEEFDIGALIGTSLMLTIAHKESADGRVFDNIVSATKLPSKIKPLVLEHTELAENPPQFVKNKQAKQIPIHDIQEHMKTLLENEEK